MENITVFDPAFARFGRLRPGYDTRRLEAAMEKLPLPELGLRFQVPDRHSQLRQAAKDLVKEATEKNTARCGVYRGYSTQPKSMLRGRRTLVFGSSDFILLLAERDQAHRRRLSEDSLTACRVPGGVLVELLSTTLYSTPIHTHDRDGCRVVVLHPRRTLRRRKAPEGEEQDPGKTGSGRKLDRLRSLYSAGYLKVHSAAVLHGLPEDF